MWKEKEYIELLESTGIDTCCFMGSGYHFPDYKEGQEFYFTYAYYGYSAKQENPEAFEAVKNMVKTYNIEVTDRWKLISRHDREFGSMIQNLRTKEVKEIRWEEDIDKFYYCLMAEPSTELDIKMEENLLAYTSEAPLLRKLMSKEEITLANKLIKEGKLQKGRSDDKQKSVCYYAIETK